VSTAVDDVKSRIDAIEKSYEFFLGYAAQGLTTDRGAKSGPELRSFLNGIEQALDGLPEAVAAAAEDAPGAPETWRDMVEVVRTDAHAALTAVRLVAARDAVSSRLVDDLNANIHLRAVLTDLFLVDELVG
jgi:hypothetical protein